MKIRLSAATCILLIAFTTNNLPAQSLKGDAKVDSTLDSAEIGKPSSVAAGFDDDPALSAEVNEAFSLSNSRIVSIDVPVVPEIPFTTVVPVGDDEFWTLDMQPHAVRSDKYRLLVQIADGSLVEHEPGPVRTMRGVVNEIDGSQVAGSLLETGFEALILLPDGTRQWLQPVAAKVAGAAPELHVLYGDEDVLSEGGACGLEEALESIVPAGATPRGGPACGVNMCEAELANDCDFQFFQDYGSVSNTEARVDSVVNTVNMQYESQVQITHVITATIVRSSEPDPYSDTNPINSGTLLSQFRNEWLANQDDIPRDVAQLFSGKNFAAPVIGQAWGIGEICGSGAYCVNESDFSGNFNCSTDLHAHELGHLWGAFHCSCPGSTMNPSITCANSFNAGTISSISAHRDSVSCLAAPESTPTSTPFFDDFPDSAIDETNWSGVDGAEANNLGLNEPSGTFALNLDGNAETGGDEIRSGVMDLSPGINTPVEYWYQRTGSGNSPEANEDLVVEYRNFVGTWIELNRHDGGGPDMTNFEFVSIVLPQEAQHENFRVRFRVETIDAGADDWFVDDVNIDMGDVFPPTPNPMTFAVLPPAPISDTQIQFEATTAIDETNSVQYFFMKEAGPACCGTSSAWQASPTYIAGGLMANSSYSYKVKARDTSQNLNQTAPSNEFASTATLIESPFEIILLDAQPTQLTLMVTCQDLGQTNRCNGGAFTNLGLPPSGLFLEMTPLEGSGSDAWVNTQTIVVSGLTPTTEYSFRAKARNKQITSPIETPFSAPFMFSTTGVPVDCPNMMPGDINQDGMIEGDDVAGYLRAKLGLPPVGGESQDCADFGTGTLDGDTAAFVAALLQ